MVCASTMPRCNILTFGLRVIYSSAELYALVVLMAKSDTMNNDQPGCTTYDCRVSQRRDSADKNVWSRPTIKPSKMMDATTSIRNVQQVKL